MSDRPVWSGNVRRGVRIPVRDGVQLSGDLYLPEEGDGPWPVVLEYQPYRKDEVDSEKRFYTVLPERGYVVARVDVRGTGASGGTSSDEYTAEETHDGYEVVEWLADQPFCDGHVNMMGISYGGFTALQVATTRPPHLTSVIPMHFTDDRYRDDCHYVGGHPRLYYDVGFYGSLMVAYNALPADPEWSPDWAEVWEEHLAGDEPYILTWLRQQVDGDYWRHGSVGDIAEQIECPVFMIGGWADGYRNAPPRLYEKLTVPKRMLIGPWNHSVPDSAVPGPRIDHLDEVVAWLDHWCGRRTDETAAGIGESPVVVYEQHFEAPVDADRAVQPGRWRAERSWPPAGSDDRTLFLGAGSTLGREAGDAATETLVHDATVGTTGGLWSAGMPFGLPGDQRPDEALSSVFTSAPLEEDLHLLGRARLDLHVATTATVLGFSVVLSDVAPDGASQLVAKGILNATRRHSLSQPEPITPGELMELAIELDTTAWRFQAGHRLRLSIANADWPNVWPTPEPAVSTVHLGATHASRLVLPVVPSRSGLPAPNFLPAPDVAAPLRHDVNPPLWRVERDALGREAWVRYHLDYGSRVSDRTVVERAYDFEAHVDAGAPSQASAFGRHSSTIRRASGTVSAVSTVNVRGSTTHFHVTIGVEVDVDGQQHHRRSWTESITRQLC